MNSKELYSEYEKLLLGKKKNFPGAFWHSTPAISRRNALTIIRYAVEKLLGWTPQDVADAFTLNLMHMMKLHTLLKYLDIPNVYEGGFDAEYIAHLLYPREISYDPARVTLDVYEYVISDKIHAYPKRFFYDEDGAVRAKICLSYVLRTKLFFTSLEEMYARFASQEGQQILTDYHLTNAALLFDSPLDYLHQSLSAAQKNEFLYNYYKFKLMYRQQKKDDLKNTGLLSENNVSDF